MKTADCRLETAGKMQTACQLLPNHAWDNNEAETLPCDVLNLSLCFVTKTLQKSRKCPVVALL